MHSIKSKAVVSLAALALVVTACSGGSGSSAAKTATSAAALGGMEELIKLAKAEGQLNVIALPPDWANYGEMIEEFRRQVRHQGRIRDQPDANSQEEIDAAQQPRRARTRRRTCSTSAPTVALANTDLFAPYQVAAWADIPDDLKEVDRPVGQRLHRLHVHRLRRRARCRCRRPWPTCSSPSTRA